MLHTYLYKSVNNIRLYTSKVSPLADKVKPDTAVAINNTLINHYLFIETSYIFVIIYVIFYKKSGYAVVIL